MPPRRSFRAPSAAAEAPAAEPLPAKRKRGSTVEPKVEEAEVPSKPPSRARRSTSSKPPSTSASKPKRSTRAKTSLPDLPESDNEEQEEDAPPPVKRARPSTDNVKVEQEDEEEPEPVKPKRGRRAASTQVKTADMDVEDEVQSKPTGRRTSARKPAVSSGSRASIGSAKSTQASGSAIVEGADAEEEEEDVKPLVKGRRAPSKAKASKRAPSKAIQSEDEAEAELVPEEEAMSVASEYEEEDDAKPSKGKKKGKAASARKGKEPTKKPMKTVVIADSDDDDVEPAPSVSRAKASPVKQPVVDMAPEAEEEGEEEKSLFEPPPMPAPSTLPTTMPEEPEGPRARLTIHKMALINFKSYAGRQEIGPFHKSFSSIVGPNGSGKSNTIDALLFVFGYRASKMRQGKISELIHNSANYPDLDECSVEVHFRDIIDLPGPDAFKVVPGSQLIVTRTAYKNNSSKYTINGRTSTYKEVQTLLKGRGIDLDHNRFLILQGEVESIAQMKPKAPTEHEDGLLEYLEDIIGTSKYKEPIEVALVEMERLQEERQVKLNRLRLVEKDKIALEAQKKEAEDYLRLKNNHVRALSRQYQWYLWRGLEQEEKLAARLQSEKKALDELVEKNLGDIEHMEALRKHYDEREKTYEEVKAAALAATKDLTSRERHEVTLQEKRKHAASRAKKLKKDVQSDTASMKAASNIVEDSTEKIKREKKKVDEFEASLEEDERILESIRDSLKDKTQVFHDKIQIKQKELQPWTAKINDLQATIDVATSERDALAKKAEALKEQCKEADEALKALKEELETKGEQEEQLEAEKAQIKKDIQTFDAKLKTAQARVNEWKGKASSARNKVEEAKSNQSENRSRNNVLDFLNRKKDANQIEGFHGRLGSLGTIPDKYDVAISTACGGGLNNMVVDTVENGQKCIELLRQNNAGRASFMVLAKLSKTGMTDIFPTPENVPRLFDLVKPKSPEYAPAFFKAIGNTLVAKDIDQANRIAFADNRRFRVVTLDGALIETSGAMSGGGSTPSRGAMSSKFAAASVSPQVLATYERDNQQAAQQLQQATDELRGLESELDNLKRREPQIEMSLQKVRMDIENVKRRTAEAEKRVRDLNAQNKPNSGDLARISKLQKEISATEKELASLKEKSGAIEEDIKELETKILEIGGSKLLTQKSKVEGLRLHLQLANEEITKAEMAKAKAEKDVVKLEASITTNSKNLDVAQREAETFEAEIVELSNYISELREQVESAQIAEENSREDLDKLKNKLAKQEQVIAAFRQEEMQLKQTITDTEKEIKENDRGIEHYNNLHDKLTLEDIDEDDEEEEEEEAAAGDADQQAGDQQGEDAPVKMEGVEAAPKPKPAKKESSHELHMYQAEELRKMRKEQLLADAAYLEEQIKKAKPDLSVLKEYKQREAEFFKRAKDLDAITADRDAQKAVYDGLRKQRLDEFMAGFSLISMKLKEMYQMITLGGNAELELVDSLDPFSEGIIFSVMPPKKSWKNIVNLSGGEKTLSSLALVFALHVFKPTPLYFMDEIDAALDFRNVSIVANYIKDRTKNAQFIIISLRNDMFELSHRLIGIYKTSNQTRSISIDNHSLHTTIPPPAPGAPVNAN